MNLHLKDRTLTWLGIMLALNLLLGLVITVGFLLKGNSLADAYWSASPPQVILLFQRDRDGDSWRPMLHTYLRKLENPEEGMYQIFFDKEEKFQYPPSSLLFFDLLPASLTEPVLPLYFPNETLRWWLNAFSTVAVLVTALACALILEVGLRRLNPQQPVRPVHVTIRFILVIALTLTFYPIVVGRWIGQIQVFINCLAALGLLFHLLGWEALSGACFGLCCLVKPQWGLIMLWSLLRRRWRFAGGMAAVLVPGLALSLARYGLADHLQYLEVLRFISRVGESYWGNQSVNGLMNRLLENGDPMGTQFFVPYNPIIYFSTLISTLVILALAFWVGKKERNAAGGPIDLSVVLVAATMASPVTWHHHFGIFVPILALALPGLMQTQPLGRWTLPLLGLSYLAMANMVIRPELIYQNYWLSIAGWHLFYGGLLCFGLLLSLRATGWNGQTAPAVNPINYRREPQAPVRQLATDRATLDAPVLPD